MQEQDTGRHATRERPPFTSGQWITVAAWSVIWIGLMLSWWSDNAAGGGWFGPGFIAAIVAVAIGVGLAVIGAVALLSRFALAGHGSRWVLLVCVPAALLVWLLGTYFADQPRYYDANTFPTGVIVEELPDDYVRTSSLHSQRGDFDVLESTTGSGELLVGTVDPRPGGPSEEIVRAHGLTFYVFVAGDQARVRRSGGPVDIEVSSDALSAETLMSISASARYDAEWDVRD